MLAYFSTLKVSICRFNIIAHTGRAWQMPRRLPIAFLRCFETDCVTLLLSRYRSLWNFSDNHSKCQLAAWVSKYYKQGESLCTMILYSDSYALDILNSVQRYVVDDSCFKFLMIAVWGCWCLLFMQRWLVSKNPWERDEHCYIIHIILQIFLLLNSLMNVCWSEVNAAGFPRIGERDARPVAACQFIFFYLTLLWLICNIKLIDALIYRKSSPRATTNMAPNEPTRPIFGWKWPKVPTIRGHAHIT